MVQGRAPTGVLGGYVCPVLKKHLKYLWLTQAGGIHQRRHLAVLVDRLFDRVASFEQAVKSLVVVFLNRLDDVLFRSRYTLSLRHLLCLHHFTIGVGLSLIFLF